MTENEFYPKPNFKPTTHAALLRLRGSLFKIICAYSFLSFNLCGKLSIFLF